MRQDQKIEAATDLLNKIAEVNDDKLKAAIDMFPAPTNETLTGQQSDVSIADIHANMKKLAEQAKSDPEATPEVLAAIDVIMKKHNLS
jgi:antitoxin component HigA of HigAB toxin-antitoxin module